MIGNIVVTLNMENVPVLECKFGATRRTTESGRITKHMVKAASFGKMELRIPENSTAEGTMDWEVRRNNWH